MGLKSSSDVFPRVVITGNDALELDDTAWDDVRSPVTAINPPGAVSDPTFSTTYIGYLFDDNSTETLFIVTQLPHTIKTGSQISPHIHWCPTTTGSGNVLWRMEYVWVAPLGEVQPGSFTTIDKQEDVSGTAYEYQLTDFGLIDKPSGLTGISDILSVKLSRVGGSDTYGDLALLKEFDIHFQVDTLGSRTEYVK